MNNLNFIVHQKGVAPSLGLLTQLLVKTIKLVRGRVLDGEFMNIPIKKHSHDDDGTDLKTSASTEVGTDMKKKVI